MLNTKIATEKEIQRFVEAMRPKNLEIRKKLDIGYSFEKQKLFLFEIRPGWNSDMEYDYEKKIQIPFAKAWYIKSRKIWQIYWMRANGNWELYDPNPFVKNLAQFFKIIELDQYGCFKG